MAASIEAIVFPKNNSVGFLADVKFEIYFDSMKLELMGFSIYKKDGGKAFLTMPSKSYTNKENQTKYQWITGGNEKMRETLQQKALQQFYKTSDIQPETSTIKAPQDTAEEPLKDVPWEMDL